MESIANNKHVEDRLARSNKDALGPHVPKNLRVHMTEGHKLPGHPSRQQIHHACVIGLRINNSSSKPRVKCESYFSGRRWTTIEKWMEFLSIINGEQV